MEDSLRIQNPIIAEKIPLIPLEGDSLKEYEARMLQKAYKIFGPIFSRERFITKTQVASIMPDATPSTMTLYFLTPNTPTRYMRPFFEELVRHWLGEKGQARIL